MNVRIASIFLMVALTACGATSPDRSAPRTDINNASGAGWVEMAPSPLSARRAAHAYEVGERLLIIGGTEAEPCPANADCLEAKEPPLTDGAIYDPATNTWERIAEAPLPLGYGSGTVIGDTLYVRIYTYGSSSSELKEAFLSYDAGNDRWTQLELPPVGTPVALTAADDKVIAYQTTQEDGVRPDLSFDPATGRWSKLPRDPLEPSFDRSMVWTDQGLVLLGIESVPNPGAEGPAVYRAAILRGNEWERLPDSEVIGWDPEAWAWSGRYVINASTESADGGEVGNWGRAYPAGGMLDPATGEWIDLPQPPGEPERTSFYASSERGMVRGTNQVFDAKALTWVTMPELPNAPESESAHTWVGDTFFVWGGTRYRGNEGSLVGTGWMWTAL